MQSNLPTETMEQFMYTYLVQKYGLKSLIVEWATSIINSVKALMNVDHEVNLFAKVLKNECDEDFRLIQIHVAQTTLNLLRQVMREKYPLKSESDISKQITRLTKNQASMSMEEAVWKRVLQKMYDRQDFGHLYAKI
jgi:hypothetical protein